MRKYVRCMPIDREEQTDNTHSTASPTMSAILMGWDDFQGLLGQTTTVNR